MTSLKRNPSDHPVSVSQPSVAKQILRRKSSGKKDGTKLTSAPLRRNSSGKGDSSSPVPRVASMLNRTVSNSSDTMTSNTHSVNSVPDSSQSQNTSHSSLVYKSHLVPSTNSDHSSMLENEVNISGNINLSHKSSSVDTPREVRLSSPNEVIDEHPKSIFLESNEEIEEPPTYIVFESNGEIEEPLQFTLLESNEEIKEPPTSIPLNPPIASPRKLAAINNSSPVRDLPFSTLQPPSPPQSHPRSPPSLRKSTEEAKNLTEEPPESSPLDYKVCFLKLHYLCLFVMCILCKIDLCCLGRSRPGQDGGTTGY